VAEAKDGPIEWPHGAVACRFRFLVEQFNGAGPLAAPFVARARDIIDALLANPELRTQVLAASERPRCNCRSATMGSTRCSECQHDLGCPVHNQECRKVTSPVQAGAAGSDSGETREADPLAPPDCPHCGVQQVAGYSRCVNPKCLRDLSEAVGSVEPGGGEDEHNEVPDTCAKWHPRPRPERPA